MVAAADTPPPADTQLWQQLKDWMLDDDIAPRQRHFRTMLQLLGAVLFDNAASLLVAASYYSDFYQNNVIKKYPHPSL